MIDGKINMIIDSDKVVTAFIGALIALLLKAIYDAFLVYQRRETVREMIIEDLVNQSEAYGDLVYEGSVFLKLIENYVKRGEVEIKEGTLINTEIFKSQPYTEYFKIFDRSYYSHITSIYKHIDIHSKMKFTDLFTEYGNEVFKCKSDKDLEEIKENYKFIVNNYVSGFSEMKDMIDELVHDLKIEYDMF